MLSHWSFKLLNACYLAYGITAPSSKMLLPIDTYRILSKMRVENASPGDHSGAALSGSEPNYSDRHRICLLQVTRRHFALRPLAQPIPKSSLDYRPNFNALPLAIFTLAPTRSTLLFK